MGACVQPLVEIPSEGDFPLNVMISQGSQVMHGISLA